MKKLLLSLMLICAFALVKAQTVVLNEVYGNPGAGNSEFIELYNSSASGSLDCYTILVYFENEGATNKGWYVLDLPNTPNINGSPGFYVLAPVTPFNVQGNPGAVSDVNWNASNFRDGTTGGYLKKFIQNGGTNATATYTEDVTFNNSTVVTNLLDGTLNGGQFYFTLLYRNGVLINGFVGGGASGVLSSYNIPLGTLTVTPSGAGCVASFNAFANLTSVEFHNPSGGSDNGYAREADGKCGSWTKTAPQINHTPGVTNGSASGDLGSLTVAQSINCNDQDPNTPLVQRTISADVTALSGDATEGEDFPVTIEFYYDANFDGELNDGLLPFDTKIQNTLAEGAVTSTPIPDNNGDYIVVYKTSRGCFDRVAPLATQCATLPVKLSLFTAARTHSNVGLVWETVTEENNKGFYVQRLIGSGSWETIGFVPSQAVNGNSTTLLHYEFNDYNPTKGITQYRLRQVDIDGKSAMSSVRAVRGEDQGGSTIVYPNPSNDGNVNIVFDNNNASRNVSVFDMNGRAIKQWRNVTNNIIRVENLTPGFYSVRIVNNDTGEQIVEKIIVNKR